MSAAAQAPPSEVPEVVELGFGPRHPAMQGVLRLRLTLDGEAVVACEPRFGFGHRGVEKLFEAYGLDDNVAISDRLDFVAAAAANLAYCGAVERLLGLGVPPRARYLRTLLGELQRVASHLLWLATYAAEAGVEAVFLPALADRERVLDLLAEYCGARLTLRCAVPGGVPREAGESWLARCATLAAELPAWVDRHVARLDEDRGFKARTVGLGVLSSDVALDLGVTGPVLRAAGVEWDVRKAFPYDAYADLDFEVPVAFNGDAYDRYRVRMEEIRQSARLLTQCVDRMPSGALRGEAPPAVDVPAAPADDRIAEAYHSVEGPRGEVGFYVRDHRPEATEAGERRLWRCHVRSPSFHNLRALPEMVGGHGIGDLVVLLGSLDLALGEVDR